MLLAKLILDPSEGAPSLQEFARRCQKIADIGDKLEAAGWELEADLCYEPLVVCKPPHDIDSEDELLALLEAMDVDVSGVGYPEVDDDDLEDVEDLFEEEDLEDIFCEDEFTDDDDDSPLMDQEEAQNLIGRKITAVDAMFDTMTLKFEDGSKLIIDGYDAILEE